MSTCAIPQVEGNTIRRAAAHGISLVGRAGSTSVQYNVLAGTGESALDVHRSRGEITTLGNQTGGWHDTSPWYLWFKKLLQPMTALWTLIVALVGASALRSRRSSGEIVHPYHHTRILASAHLALPHSATADRDAGWTGSRGPLPAAAE